MKAFVVIALVALVVLAGVEAGRDRHGGRGGHRDRVRASSKTIVTQPDGMHRFCIPIGKKAAQVDSLSLHVPRTALGFQVKLDTFPTSTFSSPLAQDDTTCKKLSSLFLVKDKQAVSTFNYATSEIVKDGAIAGVIYGPRPEWISVQLKGSQITTVDHADDVCQTILGRKSESAFDHKKGPNHGGNQEQEEGEEEETQRSKPHFGQMIVRFMFSRLTLWGFVGLGVFIIVSLIVRIVRRCRARRATDAASNDLELSQVEAEDQEASELAQAIENSLADQEKKKVVEVPQSQVPHFVFLPPNMPASGAPGAPAAYVPMFAPQYMNYSFEERQE